MPDKPDPSPDLFKLMSESVILANQILKEELAPEQANKVKKEPVGDRLYR